VGTNDHQNRNDALDREYDWRASDSPGDEREHGSNDATTVRKKAAGPVFVMQLPFPLVRTCFYRFRDDQWMAAIVQTFPRLVRTMSSAPTESIARVLN
jgi:hypothetical protein